MWKSWSLLLFGISKSPSKWSCMWRPSHIRRSWKSVAAAFLSRPNGACGQGVCFKHFMFIPQSWKTRWRLTHMFEKGPSPPFVVKCLASRVACIHPLRSRFMPFFFMELPKFWGTWKPDSFASFLKPSFGWPKGEVRRPAVENTWMFFVLKKGPKNPSKQGPFPNQNKGHLGSRYIKSRWFIPDGLRVTIDSNWGFKILEVVCVQQQSLSTAGCAFDFHCFNTLSDLKCSLPSQMHTLEQRRKKHHQPLHRYHVEIFYIFIQVHRPDSCSCWVFILQTLSP